MVLKLMEPNWGRGGMQQLTFVFTSHNNLVQKTPSKNTSLMGPSNTCSLPSYVHKKAELHHTDADTIYQQKRKIMSASSATCKIW